VSGAVFSRDRFQRKRARARFYGSQRHNQEPVVSASGQPALAIGYLRITSDMTFLARITSDMTKHAQDPFFDM
jgi:hypothetical protein